jgi:hypothetical protein
MRPLTQEWLQRFNGQTEIIYPSHKYLKNYESSEEVLRVLLLKEDLKSLNSFVARAMPPEIKFLVTASLRSRKRIEQASKAQQVLRTIKEYEYYHKFNPLKLYLLQMSQSKVKALEDLADSLNKYHPFLEQTLELMAPEEILQMV